jgi:hypothetical protein
MMTTNGHGTMREGFGSREMATSAETQTAAMQAAATAAVQARYVMATQRPRSWDDIRVRILSECARPGFAEVARYRKPIGQGIEGPSIRFAEACARYAGNMGLEAPTVYEDATKRIIRVTATDYETNASYSADVTVAKVVERKKTTGRTVLGQRTNSFGDVVYIVEATEDEILNTVNALVSKATRTLILRLIPGDIVEEGQEACVQTLNNRAAKDPAGERKRLCDAFAAIGVMPGDLARHLGHSLDAIQPAELLELRKVYATIRDGETTWREVVAGRESADAPATGEPKKSAAASLADKIKSGKKGTKAEAAPPPPADAGPPQPTVEHDADGVVVERDQEPTVTGEVVPPERQPGEEG